MNDDHDDREVLGDDDPELRRFFDGEDLSAEPVADGGKGLGAADAEPVAGVEEGLSNEDFWGAAAIAAAEQS